MSTHASALHALVAQELPIFAPSVDTSFIDYNVEELSSSNPDAPAMVLEMLVASEGDDASARCAAAIALWHDAARAAACAVAAAPSVTAREPHLDASGGASMAASSTRVESDTYAALAAASHAMALSMAERGARDVVLRAAPEVTGVSVDTEDDSDGSSTYGDAAGGVSGAVAARSGGAAAAPAAVPTGAAPASAPAAPPPLVLEAVARVSRFHDSNTTTVDLAGITITVGDSPPRELVSDASLRLTAGSNYALLGRNGCGKTILLQVLASGVLFDPDAQCKLRMMLITQTFAPPPSHEWLVEDEVRVPPFGYDLSAALDASARAHRRADLRSGLRGRQARTAATAAAAAAAAAQDAGAGGGSDSSDACGGGGGTFDLAARVAAAAEARSPASAALYGDDAPSASAVAAAFADLGIPLAMLRQRYEELSGGWRMRVTLAKALLWQPSFLLLDEPTNHLDVSGINLLLSLLRTRFAETTTIFVTHDLHFVNEAADSIIRLRDGQVKVFKGNYTTMVREQRDRKNFTDHYAHEQEKETARLLASIDASLRTTKDDKTRKQLAGRREKVLERGSGMMRNSKGHRYKRNGADNAGKFNTLLRAIEVVHEEKPVSFSFDHELPSRASSGGSLIEVSGLSFSYRAAQAAAQSTVGAATAALSPVAALPQPFSIELRDLNIVQGERVILCGPNGHGKSTLLRCLSGELVCTATTLRVGPSTAVFDQHTVASLGNEQRPVLAFAVAAAGAGGKEGEERVRKALGAFGLGRVTASGVPVSLLSGGQRVALRFALIALACPSLMLLDEPSAHLDLEAREGLACALAAFKGAIILVSHDLGFVDLVRPTRGLLCKEGRFVSVPDWKATMKAL